MVHALKKVNNTAAPSDPLAGYDDATSLEYPLMGFLIHNPAKHSLITTDLRADHFQDQTARKIFEAMGAMGGDFDAPRLLCAVPHSSLHLTKMMSVALVTSQGPFGAVDAARRIREAAHRRRAQDLARVIEEAAKRGSIEDLQAAISSINDDEQAHIDEDEYRETGDLCSTEYAVDGFLGCGPTYIAGAHGVGKSSLLVPLASIITGELEGIFGVKAYLKRRVIYFAEDPEQIDRVRFGLSKYCELKRNGNFFIRRTKRLSKDAVKVLVAKMVKEHTIVGPSGYEVKPLIIFDTLSASFELENENDNAEAAKYLSALKESGGTAPIWVIGHIPKAMLRADVENMTGRGAGAWEGDAQGTAFIFGEPDGPQNIRYLRTRKRRFEASYIEARFETSVRAEKRVAAWGEEQIITVRFGVPERSSEETRKQDVQSVVDEKRVQTVALATERIRDFLRQQAAPVSRNDIEKYVTELNSPRNSAREAIQELERNGEVDVVEKYIAKDGKTRKNGLQIVRNFASEV